MGTQDGLWCLGAAESGYHLGSAGQVHWPDPQQLPRQPLPRDRAACNKVTDRLMASGLGRFLTSGLAVQASYRGPDCGLRRGAAGGGGGGGGGGGAGAAQAAAHQLLAQRPAEDHVDFPFSPAPRREQWGVYVNQSQASVNVSLVIPGHTSLSVRASHTGPHSPRPFSHSHNHPLPITHFGRGFHLRRRLRIRSYIDSSSSSSSSSLSS